MTKRAMDIVLVILGLALLCPIVAIIALLVRIQLGRPVFFLQQRPGLHGRPFSMIKFRTMNNRCGPDGLLLPDGERLNSFGRMLRSSSLDELPEFWNVLAGDMSLVGPRPLLMEYLPRYSQRQARRHEVPPGVTGLAQVKGRNALSWEEKFELDVWYVEHRNLWLDVKILAVTALKILRREGISAAGEATNSKFIGAGSKQ